MENTEQFIFWFECYKKDTSLQLNRLKMIFQHEKQEDPYLFEKIDYVRKNIDKIKNIYGSEGLLHFACSYSNESAISYLLEKGEDPNQLSPNQTTPLTILIQNRNIKKEKKIQILYKLIAAGLSFELPKWAIKTHQNFCGYIKFFDMLDWLEEIDKNQHLLNDEQKKQWKTIRMQLLYR